MLNQRNYFSRLSQMALDLALSVAAFWVAHWLRNEIVVPWLLPESVRWAPSWTGYAWLLAFIPPLTLLFLNWNGYYRSSRLKSHGAEARAILVSVAGAAALAFVFSVIFRREGMVSRAQTALIPIIQFVLIEAKTLLARGWRTQRRKSGRDANYVLLVGSGAPLERFLDLLERRPHWGLRVAGIVSDSESLPMGEQVRGVSVVADLDAAPELMRRVRVDGVIATPAEAGLPALAPLMQRCEEMGIRTHLSLDAFGHSIARPTIEDFDETLMVAYSPAPEIGLAFAIKYVFDRVAALAALVVLSAVFLWIWAMIKRRSAKGEPALFRQTRCGLNGRTFTLWKFRTMRVGADEELSELVEQNEVDGAAFKIRDDPRLTDWGRALRRYSLDELPQFWNVFKGDMSLVGPRPSLPSEVAKYEPWHRRRLSMRPGITGLWQVSGRSLLSFETWMKLDLQYIDNWSLWLDANILARTIWAVLSGKGAM